MSLVVSFEGSDQLGDAIQAVQDPNTDLAVIRGFIDEPTVAQLANPAIDYERVLLESPHIPWMAAHALIRNIWDARGYSGFAVEDRLNIAPRYDDVGSHVDAGASRTDTPAIALGSVCIRNRTFWAERLPDSFKRGAPDEPGDFMWREFEDVYALQTGAPGRTPKNDQVPRSHADLKPGDMVVIAQHPAIVRHAATKGDNQPSLVSAFLIEWWARRTA